MSAKETYAGRADEQKAEKERRSGRRFAIILGASILILFALTVGALYAIFKSNAVRRTPAAGSTANSSNEAATANENYR